MGCIMRVCFVGHKTIEKSEELISSLQQTVQMLIRNGATTFLFGGMSKFDDLSWEIVTEFKKQYPCIKRVYVRASYQYLDKHYEEYLLRYYEETYFPSKIEKAGRYRYVERNYDMIDNSTYCIFYYNENYVPASRQASRHDMTLPSRRNSGTKIAYEYAIKKKKKIINLYKSQK